ncbi:hypothetical protein C8F01DRAFT_1100048 [Mycena amicta]|nr:hypothetical protein C8F01DRAFT_1100048 [Mycena amicta]
MTGKAQNLNDAGAQALQALLRSLDPATAGETPDNVAKLSKKLAELVGEEVGERDENGQLLNEEGLPIIELTEQVDAFEAASREPAAPTPLALLPEWELERRRGERNRILDLLEEEERVERAKANQLEEEQQHEEREKRKKNNEVELAKMKAMKDMYKKMGQSLAGKAEMKPAMPKSVKWADAEEEPTTVAQATGDVVLGRLRPNSGPSLLSIPQVDTLPMRTNVVERFPGGASQPQADSDDESEPPDSSSDLDSDEEGGLESEEELADELDLDFARHQREIALEYHAKRTEMVEVAATVLKNSHTQAADPYITAEEASTQPTRKSALSHFQASRIASSYNATIPASSGANIPSESTARALQRAIRLGKLDTTDQLVGGEAGESGSEDEDAVAQEILELLRKGEVFNAGPDGMHAVSPPSLAGPPAGPPPSARKPSSSKFKLSRSGHVPSPASTPTPPSEVNRSSPKLSESPRSSSGVMSSVVERPTAGSSAFSSMIVESPSFQPVEQRQTSPPTVMASEVIESTQTRRPQQPPTIVRAADAPPKVSRFLAGRHGST